ncbi:hypothetical protein ACFW96_33070 [Streptomyces gardneri]|uniref:hypothetical protein n=1 Tax=Streptomyces gardneri TaxID=66892 RepID=UPI0036755E00
MDTLLPVTGPLPDQTRLPLTTFYEAKYSLELLMRFADDTPKGRASGEWARTLAQRLPED